MKFSKIALLVVCSLSFLASGFAQSGSLKGFVYLKESGEPAIFVNVVLKGTAVGSTTDENGYYTMSNVPLGTYTLKATSIGLAS